MLQAYAGNRNYLIISIQELSMMVFAGISRVFSTANSQQYEAIGDFWQEMSDRYGRCRLRGLGYNWTADSIQYVIGFKEGVIPGANCSVDLPDSGWTVVEGRTAELSDMYDRIYQDGALLYEIEAFDDQGQCQIMFYR